ncbi:MAG TPA: GNAT family N-acetyltransferase [Phycisphaerae bacterium]|nr:GNAT family N-acetyltransferase [Phycisphaerae bacterium]HRY70331.1 GNAT family N-acetyltransferase [Phycisphaerae bacterium]HSA28048.1 GNAT family N-acetyltransferase [Phycisphaerae bacterium]
MGSEPASEITQAATILSFAGEDADYAAWDDFVIQHPRGHYFQLHGWLSSYRPMGLDCEVLTLKRGGQIVAGAAFAHFKLPLVDWRVAILPHGPVCDEPGNGQWREVMAGLEKRFVNDKVAYVQAWPPVRLGDEPGLGPYRRAGYVGGRLFHAHEFSSTLLSVDLTRSEDRVLAESRRNTRYYGRKSRTTGLRLHLGTTAEDLAQSYEVWLENGAYHGYEVRPLSSFQIILSRLIAKDRALLIQAWKGDCIAGSILVLFAGRVAVYAQGGMRREFESCYPGEFMHLEAMRLGRERGCVAYDFNNWGTEGTTLFKSGFRPVEHRWSEPVTRVYRPLTARFVAWGEVYCRPLLRAIARRRANRQA